MPEHGTRNSEAIKIKSDFLLVRTLITLMVVTPIIVFFSCAITAKIYQNEETFDRAYCDHVRNFIPSISAVIGIVPQIYFWRTCVALLVTPKIFIGELYRAFFASLADSSNSEILKNATQWLLLLSFWCNIVNAVALCGLTFVSNLENYVVHEKCFIVFISSTFFDMILVMTKFTIFKDYLPLNMVTSLRVKVILFSISVALGIVLFLFYELHINWCVENTFSWFSLSEYGIILCILFFHWTMALDFPDKRIKFKIM